MNHRKELIWNKFSEQFFYASLKLERNEKLWISNLFIQFLGEPTFDVQVFFTIGYRGWCMMQICILSRYVIPPEFFYSCSCLDMSVIPPEELLLLLMPNSDSWCLQWSHCQLSRNICFTTFQKDSTFDVRLKYSLKIQFQPKRKSSKLGFVAMQCCGRFSYIQKAGDAGDISPPPIFWVFRQSLGWADSQTPVLTRCAAANGSAAFAVFLQLTICLRKLNWDWNCTGGRFTTSSYSRSHTLCCLVVLQAFFPLFSPVDKNLTRSAAVDKNQDVNLSRLFSHVHVHVLVARLLQAGGLHRRKH